MKHTDNYKGYDSLPSYLLGPMPQGTPVRASEKYVTWYPQDVINGRLVRVPRNTKLSDIALRSEASRKIQ